MILKMPWIDRGRCDRKLDCAAARVCPRGALEVGPESEEEEGRASEYPLVDLEHCRRCGDCAKACPEGAVKMV
ncbi:MAG: 4Fe-4S binding protein [Actinobacteria bacterium]|nr:4Fe-4S binding protein [Actinomycetota bacterium]MBU1944610.1 4Fe-4S binding protein [Actinomycetota bacterium]MBU2689163.1 4Fe-4S binding protein [Actinomycetota bacterium]